MLLIAALMIMLVTPNDPTTCLPSDIKPGDVVSVERVNGSGGAQRLKKITVRDVLKQVGAHCLEGKLLDAAGKEIRFYRLVGCWGNPPEDYQEILDKQNRELEKLKKSFHVIEISCNTTGEQIS